MPSRMNESFVVNHGTVVGLAHSHLVDGSETVFDPVTDTTYERGTDYDISYTTGEITVLSTGAMADGQACEVDYRWIEGEDDAE